MAAVLLFRVVRQDVQTAAPPMTATQRKESVASIRFPAVHLNSSNLQVQHPKPGQKEGFGLISVGILYSRFGCQQCSGSRPSLHWAVEYMQRLGCAARQTTGCSSMSTNFTSQDLSFSPVSDDDFEDLLAIRIAAMKESLSRIGRFDPSRARERFKSGFSPENTRHVVVSGSCAGFVTVKPFDDGLLLDHLYVLPSFQGHGIGALVLASIFKVADADRQQIRVGALKESDSNRFYERHGFKLVSEGEWDNYYVRSCQTLA